MSSRAANRSSCSTMQRSVPCTRSKNGDTTASRNSARPSAVGLLRRWTGLQRCGQRQFWQAKENPKQQPHICIHYEVLIWRHRGKGHRHKQHARVPENHKGYREPRRAFEFDDNLPGMKQDGGAHDEPKDQAANSHFDDDASEPTLDRTNDRAHIEESRNVLAAQRNGSDAVAVRPTRIIERG